MAKTTAPPPPPRNTSEQIRSWGADQTSGEIFLQEIAAQLAEQNEIMRLLHPELNMPKQCQERKCDYYICYLSYGAPDLTHEGYHAACEQAEQHYKKCSRCNGTSKNLDDCQIARNLEDRLRA